MAPPEERAAVAEAASAAASGPSPPPPTTKSRAKASKSKSKSKKKKSEPEPALTSDVALEDGTTSAAMDVDYELLSLITDQPASSSRAAVRPLSGPGVHPELLYTSSPAMSDRGSMPPPPEPDAEERTTGGKKKVCINFCLTWFQCAYPYYSKGGRKIEGASQGSSEGADETEAKSCHPRPLFFYHGAHHFLWPCKEGACPLRRVNHGGTPACDLRCSITFALYVGHATSPGGTGDSCG
jgi:hypothetical protein